MQTTPHNETKLIILQDAGKTLGNHRAGSIQEARNYLANIESVAREARQSTDPRVLATALGVIGLQAAQIPALSVEL